MTAAGLRRGRVRRRRSTPTRPSTSRRSSPTSPRPRPTRITGQVFVVYGGMVALLAAPVVEQRFDAAGDLWDLADLDKQLGGFFADRDPSVGFAADSVMQLKRLRRPPWHDLQGKVAIVTGGAQGQGAAIARAFVAEGAQVVDRRHRRRAGQGAGRRARRARRTFPPPRRQRRGLLDRAGRRRPTSGSGRSTCWPTTPASCASARSSAMPSTRSSCCSGSTSWAASSACRRSSRRCARTAAARSSTPPRSRAWPAWPAARPTPRTKFAIRGMTKARRMELGAQGHPGQLGAPRA